MSIGRRVAGLFGMPAIFFGGGHDWAFGKNTGCGPPRLSDLRSGSG
jgi:hypothetical protein